MDKLPVDLEVLPEPLKSMVRHLDPEMIKNLISMYDPQTLSVMLNSMLSMFKQSIPPEQYATLAEMVDNVTRLIPQEK